ncbi:MAG: GtrA family protein [Mogibacterium sp.]|nr:GtrA family protein [Mogibacterium sp.]
MDPKNKEDVQKNFKEIIAYLVFGVLTTLVNIVVYWVTAHPLGIKTVPSSIIAWIAAVLFAYVTNRIWVFHSETSGRSGILREMFYFFSARLATGIIDWVFMYVTVDVLSFNDVYMKVIANVIVIILNYVASKLLIFRKPENK